MHRFLKIIPLLIIIISVFSCEKSTPASNPIGLIGEWIWAQTYFGGYLTPQNTAIRKTLVFNQDSTLTLTHNDSIGYSFELSVTNTILLAESITKTEQFTTGNPNVIFSGLLPFTDSAYLIIGNGQRAYQYSVSGDSLFLQNFPGLSPLSTVYVRAK